jgi:hypothetical protein
MLIFMTALKMKLNWQEKCTKGERCTVLDDDGKYGFRLFLITFYQRGK